MPASILTVAGTAYPSLGSTSRAGSRLGIDRLVRSVDGPGSLEFHEYTGTLPPSFHGGQSVTLSIDGTPYFTGEIASVHDQFVGTGWIFGYQCRDALGAAQALVPVTNPADFTGSWTFNRPSNDPYYVPAWAGQSVGGILGLLLTNHATALAAAGVAGYVAGDLTGLTLVPPQPITVQGPSLVDAIRGFLDEWAGHVAFWFDYQSGTTDWRIRFGDPTAWSPLTLTLDSDPVDPPSISRDTAGSYTQVVVRGQAIVEAWTGSVLQGTLTPAWTTTGVGNQQSTWTVAEWNHPKGTYDQGTVTALTSTTATVQSDDPAAHWVTNFWSTNQGDIFLLNPVATGITQQEQRDVTANASMTAGGTAVITLDRPLVNGGYTRYHMFCQPPGGEVDVWRRYNINNTQVAAHLLTMFPQPVRFSNGSAAVETSYPMAMVFFGGGAALPAQFEIDPQNGQIRFNQPVILGFNSDAQLAAGGSSVTPPDDVLVLLAYGRGALTATAPASGHAGTAFTVEGISRTLYVDVPQWIRAGDQATYDAYAAMKLRTVQDSVVTGNVSYKGLYSAGLALGQALNIAGLGYTTGWETLAAPIRSVVVEWQSGPAGVNWITHLSLSNRRRQATGDSFYVHPQFAGAGAGEGGQGQGVNVAGGGVQGVGGGPLAGGFGDIGAASQSLAPSAFGGPSDPLGSAVAGSGSGGMGGGFGSASGASGPAVSTPPASTAGPGQAPPSQSAADAMPSSTPPVSTPPSSTAGGGSQPSGRGFMPGDAPDAAADFAADQALAPNEWIDAHADDIADAPAPPASDRSTLYQKRYGDGD